MQHITAHMLYALIFYVDNGTAQCFVNLATVVWWDCATQMFCAAFRPQLFLTVARRHTPRVDSVSSKGLRDEMVAA